jgi:3-hydroxyacyl-CoA dehydrogenase
MTQVVTFTKQGAVGVIAISNPPVNALSHAVRVKLLEVLASAFQDADVQALVIACEGRTFVAGADIREFGAPPLAPDLPEVVEFVDASRVPVVAAIHGTALGGGLELALACHYRVAAASSRVGLPEVNLGILPGAGGTQRLPRLVGVRAALDLIISGVPISAARARAIGLIDEMVEGDPRAAAVAFAARVVAEQRPLRKASALPVRLDDANVFAEYEQRISGESRGPRAPFLCIEALRAAVELPFGKGLERERELFIELMNSSESKAQRHVFFGEREVAKPKELPEATPAREVKAAAVIGASEIGVEIAICLADARVPVSLIENTEEDLVSGLASIRSHYASAVASGALKQPEADQRLSRIQPTLARGDLQVVDLVIDASSWDIALRSTLFRELGVSCKAGAILSTSASQVDLEQLGTETKRPEDVVGLHFARPVQGTRLLEIARGRATAPEVCATAIKLAKTLGKVPVLVRASREPVGERILSRCLREVSCLLEEGVPPAQLDRVFREFGFARGPLRGLADPAGSESEASLGKLSERGVSPRAVTDQEVLDRCIFAMVNEGVRVLEDGSVSRPLEIDMICVHGYGFPAHRGGPMFHAEQVGLDTQP